MRAANHDAQHDPIANPVLLIAEILRILAITGPGVGADRRSAALVRAAADLRALVASGAGVRRMRGRALRGITMAEASVRAQCQEALPVEAKQSRGFVALALSGSGRTGRRSSTQAMPEPDEDALLRARSQELLDRLATLRHELTYTYREVLASALSHDQPAPRAVMDRQLASEEAL